MENKNIMTDMANRKMAGMGIMPPSIVYVIAAALIIIAVALVLIVIKMYYTGV